MPGSVLVPVNIAIGRDIITEIANRIEPEGRKCYNGEKTGHMAEDRKVPPRNSRQRQKRERRRKKKREI